jgi:hypothetical protein
LIQFCIRKSRHGTAVHERVKDAKDKCYDLN